MLSYPRSLRAKRPLGAATAILFALTTGLTACRKPETGTAPSKAEAAAPAKTPVEVPAPGPSFREKAEGGGVPFAGLHAPRGIAVDDRGRVWVMDTGGNAIRVFDASGGSLGGWGGKGTGHYALRDPFGISIRGDAVLVSDTAGAGVELFSLAGEFRARADAGLFGPRGAVAGADGRVWIADTGNDRVVLCDPNLTNPRAIGSKGAGRENFASPIGIAVGPSGSVYVADTVNRRIQILDPKGAFKASWKVDGFGPDNEPYLDVDDDESIYASDALQNAVLHIDRSGRETRRWKQDDAGKKFSRPTGLALDRKARVLYVVNSDADTVVKLKLPAK